MPSINELTKSQHVSFKDNFYALVHKIDKGSTKDGKLYLSIVLQDASGMIMSKKWNVKEDELDNIHDGDVVHVSGKTKEFKDRIQFIVDEIVVIDTVDKDHFIPCAPLSESTLKDEVTKYLLKIKNPTLHRITQTLLNKYEDSFFVYPAASKNHHEFKSGLSYHVKTMLDLAKAICDIYPTLDRDLLYAGVILHDLGKVIELSGYESPSYTPEGKLLGHITITANEVAITAKELGLEGEEVMLLEHMIIAHHGKLEYGSPKVPMLREAEVLNLIDNVDARIIMMNAALENAEHGEFTSRIFALENRQFYKANYYNKD